MLRGNELSNRLKLLVGRRHVLTSARSTLRYRRGYRSPAGPALAVVRPGSLVEYWRVLQACVQADVAIIVQAANTGLTGGSNPDERIGRPVVIISTARLRGLHLIDDGQQVVCLPGTTLFELEQRLRPIGREPHSVIGSSCFGASVVGGVCNNSGGALIQRGPAYTELALFARLDAEGNLRLVNRLGIDLGDDPEAMLARLEAGTFDAAPVQAAASDGDYHAHVRQIDAATPARFNADPRRLHDASGCAGKLAVFAVRLDSFAAQAGSTTFYLGANDPAAFAALRRTMLGTAMPLPISAEYLHRDTFDIADRYGRDTFQAIRMLGTARLPTLFALKARIDGLGAAIGLSQLSERLMQMVGRLLPSHLPPRLREWRDRYEHHLILKVAAGDAGAVRDLLRAQLSSTGEGWFECTGDEADKAGLHRFVAAGAAVRLAAVERRRTDGIVALDVALPRNGVEWFGPLPADLADQVVATLRYGHFFCHVFHRDYVLARGADPHAVKRRLLEVLDGEGAEYPAEHNVGRQYRAKPALADFYRSLDPSDRMNPGIGAPDPGKADAARARA